MATATNALGSRGMHMLPREFEPLSEPAWAANLAAHPSPPPLLSGQVPRPRAASEDTPPAGSGRSGCCQPAARPCATQGLPKEGRLLKMSCGPDGGTVLTVPDTTKSVLLPQRKGTRIPRRDRAKTAERPRRAAGSKAGGGSPPKDEALSAP